MPPHTTLACPTCGAGLKPGETVCPNCGTPVTGVAAALAHDSPGSPVSTATTFSWDAVANRLQEITLGQYQILTELGRGGMAAVYLAHEYALNRKVALKVMSPAIMMTDGMIERFHAEAVTQANLTHSNIVGVHAVRRDQDLHYFVMQYVPGRSLQQVVRAELDARRLLPLPVIGSLLYQIGSALSYAHRRGVIHRDIKPANVMLNADGDAVVTDFGIAKVTSTPSQTMTGTVVGTAPYMSPEQCYASELTGASDQYSLGILAYELLVGSPPFSGTSFVVMQAHTMQAPPPLGPRRPDCPPAFEAAVMKMLAKRREDRFPDINAALSALQARPASSSIDDPVRHELVRLADVAGVEASLADVLRVPVSPTPQTRPPRARSSTPVATSTPPSRPPYVPDASSVDVVMLRLDDPPARVEPGERIRFTATASDAQGTRVAGAVLRWSSSNTKVARVAPDTGEIDALAVGSTDIVVTCGDAVATTRLAVRDPAVVKIVGDVIPGSIEIGETVTVTARGLDTRGARVDRPISWSVRDGSAATVTANGALTARSPGAITLVAACGDAKAEFPIRVLGPRAARVELLEVPNVLGLGESMTVSARVFDKAGRELKGSVIRWTSKEAAVVKISGDATLTGVAPGRASIEARCDDAVAVTPITVGLVPIAKLDVDGMPARIKAGTTKRLKVAATDSSGRVRGLPAEWTSSDPRVASVDTALCLSGLAPGQANLRVRCGTVERSFPIDVYAAVPFTENARRVWAGVPRWLVATAGTGAAVLLVAFLVLPKVFKPSSVAPPASQQPEPTPPPAARTDSVVTARTDSVVSARADTVVSAPPVAIPPSTDVTRLAISPPRFTQLERGDSLMLRATKTGGGAVQGVRWTSSDPRVAQIGARTGRLVATGVGSVSIVAEGDNGGDTLAFTVVDPRLKRLDVRGTHTLKQGEETTFAAEARSEHGLTIAPANLRWSSSSPDVLYFDPGTGRAHARSGGKAMVSADAGGVRSPEHAVTVEAAVVAPVPVPTPPAPREQPPVSPPSDAGNRPRSPDAATVSSAARACQDAYISKDETRIVRLGGRGNATEDENQQNLLALIKRARNVQLSALGTESVAVMDGDVARFSVQLFISWTSAFGRDITRDLTLRGTMGRAGNGWTLASCRIQEHPNLK